ncbi:ISKra4 family transposase [Fimbriiglobus ruber]|uniref:ISKra4 family transposase n=1 Tax=Fimbriiglobus ruber TaxID=1908690 RepID=A0A225E7P5_9BACT|nr:ISKra4 family transposase [Fimbriiglobus ruber]OWK37705.1 hypothetical protein FRUB_06825 [Fimbriiglobus ruber]OWK38635.1 hypothetical protein FRUB_07755 [Fimbriiglobus ruber]OWK39337.1 hypothetical protein FRUB_05900 [Fimbriiglobus ruber]OWK40291.1 hypothetical protein FRUB_05210 [Fimbriiglobus ruber]OWK40298.1 hypothetical protein FRUB_05217 [Fimbriiglobus ruber]
MTCPHCRESARCKGFKSRQLVSLFGPLEYSRHYYLCRHCHHGISPLDGVLGLRAHDLTPAADEVVCLSGLEDSFATAADTVLPRLAGLRVSESTVQRATEAAGERLAEAQHAGQTFGPSTPWAWHKDADGKTVGYVSVDATGVGQQGSRGAKAEGRMAYIGMIDNPVPEERPRWANPTAAKRPEWKARYVSQVRSLAELAEPLRRQASQVNLGGADRWVALSDGGIGLEDFLRANFPRVEAVILDFYHVAEYVAKLSRVLHPGDADADRRWRETTCEELKTSGGSAVLEKVRSLDLADRAGAASVRAEVVTYFTNQTHRMDYPHYLAQGWQIGSGPVESACKTVIGERMKGGGMRWGEDGADAMSHLRALFCSSDNQWAAFWSKN